MIVGVLVALFFITAVIGDAGQGWAERGTLTAVLFTALWSVAAAAAPAPSARGRRPRAARPARAAARFAGALGPGRADRARERRVAGRRRGLGRRRRRRGRGGGGGRGGRRRRPGPASGGRLVRGQGARGGPRAGPGDAWARRPMSPAPWSAPTMGVRADSEPPRDRRWTFRRQRAEHDRVARPDGDARRARGRADDDDARRGPHDRRHRRKADPQRRPMTRAPAAARRRRPDHPAAAGHPAAVHALRVHDAPGRPGRRLQEPLADGGRRRGAGRCRRGQARDHRGLRDGPSAQPEEIKWRWCARRRRSTRRATAR